MKKSPINSACDISPEALREFTVFDLGHGLEFF